MSDNTKVFTQNCRIYIMRKIFKLDYKKFIDFTNLNINLNEYETNFVNNKKLNVKIAINIFYDDDILGLYIYDNNGNLIKNII